MPYRQELKEQEGKLYTSLFKIYRKIQRDLDNDASWNEVQALYHKQTDDIIRSAVTSIYEISARKTVERDVRRPYFLTQQDLQEIKRVAQKYQDSFWLALNREVTARSSLGGVKVHYHPETLLLIKEQDSRFRQGFISRISQSVHGEAAAIGVVSKARQVVAVPLQSQRMRRTSFRKAAIGTGAELVPHLTWRTAEDETVCDECSGFNGQAFALDEDMPIPSSDTHPRCRCELVFESGEEEEGIEEREFAEGLFF